MNLVLFECLQNSVVFDVQLVSQLVVSHAIF